MSVQQQQSAAADKTFTTSLPSFVLNYGGWSDASLESATTKMEQLIDEEGSRRYALPDNLPIAPGDIHNAPDNMLGRQHTGDWPHA